MKHPIIIWSAIAIAIVVGMPAMASAQARPIPMVKTPDQHASPSSFQFLGDGVYPATTSCLYPHPALWPGIPMVYGGFSLTAPSVVGVFWPGEQSANPGVSSLFGDFVTDLFNGPYWSATMPQYVGSAQLTLQPSVHLTTLLTVAPNDTVRSRDIAGELRAQQLAGVLPPADFNAIYVVNFPPGITITDETYIDENGLLHVSIGTSCVQYCAYHDYYAKLEGGITVYFAFAVMPDYSQNAGCAAACGSGSPFDVYTEVLTHELLETVTDPYNGVGWMNGAACGIEEVSDVCREHLFYVPRRTSTPGTPECPNQWAMSSAFSNAAWNPSNANGCVVADAVTPQDCVSGVDPQNGLTAALELSAPQPNPAVGSTQLRYSLPLESFVRLSVLDVAGRQVAVLARQVESSGAHSVTWDGRDTSGRLVPAGIYFSRLEAAGRVLSRTIVLGR